MTKKEKRFEKIAKWRWEEWGASKVVFFVGIWLFIVSFFNLIIFGILDQSFLDHIIIGISVTVNFAVLIVGLGVIFGNWPKREVYWREIK